MIGRAACQRVVHINDWPIAAKITVLCTAIAIVLAVGTDLDRVLPGRGGTCRNRRTGRSRPTRTWCRPRSTTGIGNGWTCWRLAPSLRRLCALPKAGDAASPRDRVRGAGGAEQHRSAQSGHRQRSGSWIAAGAYVLDVDPAALGRSGPQYDFFQQAMQGREFISGVTISGVTAQTGAVSLGADQECRRCRGRRAARPQLAHDRHADRPGRRWPPGDERRRRVAGRQRPGDRQHARRGLAVASNRRAGGGGRGVAGQRVGVGYRMAPRRLLWATPSWRARSASNSRPCSTGR